MEAQKAFRMAYAGGNYWAAGDERPHDQLRVGNYFVALVEEGKFAEAQQVAVEYSADPVAVVARLGGGGTEVVALDAPEGLSGKYLAFFQSLPAEAQRAFLAYYDTEFVGPHREGDLTVGRFLVDNAGSEAALAVGRAYASNPAEVAAFAGVAVGTYGHSTLVASTGEVQQVEPGLGTGNFSWEGVFGWVEDNSLSLNEEEQMSLANTASLIQSFETPLDLNAFTANHFNDSIPGSENVKLFLLDIASHWSVELEHTKDELVHGNPGFFESRVLSLRIVRLSTSIGLATLLHEFLPSSVSDIAFGHLTAQIPTDGVLEGALVEAAKYSLTSDETQQMYNTIRDSFRDWWDRHIQ